jgi:hypothetical protein
MIILSIEKGRMKAVFLPVREIAVDSVGETPRAARGVAEVELAELAAVRTAAETIADQREGGRVHSEALELSKVEQRLRVAVHRHRAVDAPQLRLGRARRVAELVEVGYLLTRQRLGDQNKAVLLVKLHDRLRLAQREERRRCFDWADAILRAWLLLLARVGGWRAGGAGLGDREVRREAAQAALR